MHAAEGARTTGDPAAFAEAALAVAATIRFGTHPGRAPALLHEAYAGSDGSLRVRLAAALARIWAYGGDAARGLEFAHEALGAAEAAGDPALLADALDALLVMRWGPDDLDERVAVTARLEDAVALLPDVEPRLSAHLWRLTTALECLDPVALHRMLRALDLLAAESGSPRVRLFAESRHGMAALLRGDADEVAARLAATQVAAAESGEADGYALERVLSSGLARLRDDVATLALEAAIYEEYGVTEGVPSILAEGALLWLDAGRPDRAGSCLARLGPLAEVPRDVDWLLTVSITTDAAARLGDRERAAEGLALLTPYAGRAVVNAGAVAFAGVVDEVLHRACRCLGEPEAEVWLERAVGCYRRLGATWWEARLAGDDAATAAPPVVVHLHPDPGGLWTVGAEGRTRTVRDLKGLHHLRALLARPGCDVPAIALAGAPGAELVESRADLADGQALAAYRRRLHTLDEELDEARGWADTGRIELLEDERDALLAEVGAVTGLGGRARGGSSAAERARVAVRKAVAGALAQLDAADPALARRLRSGVVTGAVCRYEPDPDHPVVWVLDSGEHPPRT